MGGGYGTSRRVLYLGVVPGGGGGVGGRGDPEKNWFWWFWPRACEMKRRGLDLYLIIERLFYPLVSLRRRIVCCALLAQANMERLVDSVDPVYLRLHNPNTHLYRYTRSSALDVSPESSTKDRRVLESLRTLVMVSQLYDGNIYRH